MTEAPKRVRVTADVPPRRSNSFTRGIALPGAPVDDAEDVYVRALMRDQLRLALGSVAGFVIVVVALAVTIALIPGIDGVVFWGFPLAWLLQAFAFYPVILVFALLYIRTAVRNERRYHALKHDE